MRNSSFILLLLFLLPGHFSVAQLYNRISYHDKEKSHIKELYQVKDTVRNILHGRYISFFYNGNPDAKGQFINNETSGVWEFFYETGNLKMRGILKQNSNYGLWEYFYESGQKSMEGTLNGKNKDGEWKSYFENGQLKEIGSYENNKHSGLWKAYYEDGVLKGECDYADDFGRYIEYYHSGKIFGEGPRMGQKNTGHWRFYAEDGTLQMEGEYENGKKQGEWVHYFPSGKVHSKGHYEHDLHVGKWEHYFETGEVSKSGEYTAGVKKGTWKSFAMNGAVLSESEYTETGGQHKEYYPSGKLLCAGSIKDDKREGKWIFYFENGKKEGECEYQNGHGTFYGYDENGALKTKGPMEEDRKVGTWEIYETDGRVSGYYKPFYDDKESSRQIARLAGKNYKRTNASHTLGLSYFDPRVGEFKGLILEGNPLFSFIGLLPIGIEFYNQERLGHEFEFVGIRNPFFTGDEKVALNKIYERGYNIAIKQKLYNPLKAGMWYFGHEVRFTNLGHFVNIAVPSTPDYFLTASSTEQRISYGGLLGYRIMKKNNAPGFTIDAFVSYQVGYRKFSLDPVFSTFFEGLNKKSLATVFGFGLNIGNVFSYK